jgi:transcription initiation factor TFIID subunit 6
LKSSVIADGFSQPLLHPPYPLHKPSFVPVYTDGTQPSAGPSTQPQLYFLRDEEIDLVSYLKGVHPAAGSTTVNGRHVNLGGTARKGKGAGVRWKAHWLAVEGVQPLIKENPISQIQEDRSGTAAATGSSSAAAGTGNASTSATRKRKLQASVAAAKTHLSQELLLFFTRITEALIPNPAMAATRAVAPTNDATEQKPEVELTEPERSRLAALSTLAGDPSLSDLLPYLVRWLSEMIMVSISGGTEGRTTAELGYLLDGMQALITNPALFIEPYVSRARSRSVHVLMECSCIKCCRRSCPFCCLSHSATDRR